MGKDVSNYAISRNQGPQGQGHKVVNNGVV